MRPLAGVSIGWFGISMVSDGVPALLVPHQLAASGGGATAVGLLTFAAIALAAIAQPFAGAWSDRVGRVPVVATGAAIAVVGLAALLIRDGLLAGTILALVGVSVAQAGYQSLMPDRIPMAARGRAAGAKGLFDVGGAFLAFALVGGLLAAGAVAASALLLAIGLAGTLVVALVVLPRRTTAPSMASGQSNVGGGGGIASLVVGRFLFLLGIYAVGRFLLLFTSERLGLGADAAAGEVGAALAALTLITALAAVPAGLLSDRIGRRRVMLIGGGVAALGVAALPVAGSMAAILAFGSLMAVGTAMFGAGSWAALADATAGNRSGRLLGIANVGTAGAAAAAGLFGPVIDTTERLAPGFGYAVAFGLAAAVAGIGGVVGWGAGRAPGRALRPALEVID